MENATKALMIAAGILFALILFGTFIYLFTQISQNSNLQDKAKLMEQVNEFNKPYEAYQRNLIRGVEIASLCNRANSYNTQNYDLGKEEKIHIYITLTLEDWEEKRKNVQYDMTGYNFDQMKKNNAQGFHDFKIKYFKCEKIEYNKNTGKVNKMYFIEVDEEALFENSNQ